MGRPEITADQREMAVVVLANAGCKNMLLRPRPISSGSGPTPCAMAWRGRRTEPSQRYVDGMRDLLRVQFPNGHAQEECLEEVDAPRYRRLRACHEQWEWNNEEAVTSAPGTGTLSSSLHRERSWVS